MDIGSVVTGSKGNDIINGYGKSGAINGGAGNDALFAIGDNGDNRANGIILIGGAGDDWLRGFRDVTLVGGKEDDRFPLTQGSGSTIADFSGNDFFHIHAQNFEYYDHTVEQYVVATFDPTSLLVTGTDPKATSAMAQFLYDTDDGKLYFDADGVGAKFELDLVTTLANKAAIKASDFVFVI